MNLRDLKYIVAVADQKSFSRAAEQCCVSQPALSMKIRKLETKLGVEIFDRSDRRIECTCIGAELVFKAKTILKELEVFYEIASDNKDHAQGKHDNIYIGELQSVDTG